MSKPSMRSPIGERKIMQKFKLEEGLSAYRCNESEGIYIPQVSYWIWLKNQPERLEHLPLIELSNSVIESEPVAKLCPETGTIMMRCKVGYDFKFYIDRSRTGGIWLDAGEWEALKVRNFHDELHLIFTEPWQTKVLEQQKRQMNQKMLNEKLEPALIEQIENLKKELKDHPHRAYAVAYLEQES